MLGHVEIAYELFKYGADLKLPDNWGVKCIDLIQNPGPIGAEDALKYFNITQRPPRFINRLLQPELANQTDWSTHKSDYDKYSGWPGGYGGWDGKRLPGYETDMSCDVDMYYTHEITPEEVFTKYIARNTPILIRGLIHEWGAIKEYTRERLNATHGTMNVQVSNIPYYNKFGGDDGGVEEMKLKDYINDLLNHKLLGAYRY